MAMSMKAFMTMAVLTSLVAVEAGVNFVPDVGALRRSLLLSKVDLDDPSVDQASLDCLIQEGCIGASTGIRTLLRFTTEIANRGDTDYSAGVPPSERIDQGPWHWDTCHEHWHFQDYARYELKPIPGSTPLWPSFVTEDGTVIPAKFQGHTRVIAGKKNGFCLMDSTGARIGHGPRRQTCDQKKGCCDQGISAGCADIYSNGLQCQWIDVTGVDLNYPYLLEVKVNPEQVIEEDDYEDNLARVVVDFNRVADGPGNAFLFAPAPDPGDCN